MRYWKEGFLFGACIAACSAPLLLGSAAVGFGSIGLGFLGWSAAGAALVLGAIAFAIIVQRKSKSVPRGTSDGGCGCAPTAGCNSGNTCDVPAPSAITEMTRTAHTAGYQLKGTAAC